MEGHNCRDEREDGPCHPERHPDGHKQREVLLHLLHLEGQGLRERLQALAKCASGSGKGIWIQSLGREKMKCSEIVLGWTRYTYSTGDIRFGGGFGR